MLPDLQAAILCDDVRQERNGKFIVIGVFDGLSLPSLPFVLPRMCLLSRWCCGQGEFEQHSRLLGPDGQTVVADGRRIPIRLADSGRVATSVEIFLRLQFREAGLYWVEVLLDRQLKLRFPLHVRLVPAPAQPPPGGEARP